VKAWAGNLALLGATVAGSLLVLEVAARVLYRTPGAKATRSQYLEYDPLLGWSKRPGARTLFEEPEYKVEVAINSKGLRGPERTLDPAPGVTRVLALGDSFVEGYSVPEGSTVSAQLEGDLGEKGCPSEVVNGGTSAYSTDQEYLFYESVGVSYLPKIVVLFFYYNDIVYNALQSESGTPKPILVLRDGELRVYRTPVERPKSAARGKAPTSPPGLHSVLIDWIGDRLWYGAPELYDRLGRFGLWELRTRAGPPLELRVYERTENERVEAGWEATALILDHLHRHVTERGGHFLVAYIPSRMEVDEKAWAASRYAYPLLGPLWDRGLVGERLQALGKKDGYPILDLRSALLGGDYFPRDGHWNASGHKAAAAAVRDFLQKEAWLSCLTPPGPPGSAAPRS
jgi:hypothetical protein